VSDWQPGQRYPDPLIHIVDQSFARYRIAQSKVERLATGFRWAEGPVHGEVSSGSAVGREAR
jgi:gluconolactonase